MTLKSDSTIREVIPTLEKPKKYVCTVLDHLNQCKGVHKNSRAKIGITGKGRVPYHMIVYLDGDGTEQVFGAYDGQHLFSETAAHDHCWSSVSTTIEEVRDLQYELCEIEI
jgi:hypothetical protein